MTRGRWAGAGAGVVLPARLHVFRHRSFRLFYGGQAISLVGTWMQTVAQGWLVLQLTNDPFTLGLVSVAQFLPVTILGLFGGVVADALPKRAGLVATQVISALLALALGLLTESGRVEVWQVIILAFLLGAVNAFDMPIRQSFVIEMVGREDIASAVGFNSALFNAARVLGPAVGGLVIGLVGTGPCFLFNAASFLPVIAGLLLIRPRDLHPHAAADRPHSVREVGGRLAEGLRHVLATPVILLCISLVGVVSLTALNNQVLMPLAARDLLGGDAATYGFLGAAMGVGSVVSSVAVAFGRTPTLRYALIGSATMGAGILCMGFSRALPVSLLLMVAVGWGLIALAATTNTIIQLSVPDQLRGRVMSVYLTVFAGVSPVGALIAGTLAASFGIAVTLVLGGASALLAVAVAAVIVHRSPRLAFRMGAIPEAERTAAA